MVIGRSSIAALGNPCGRGSSHHPCHLAAGVLAHSARLGAGAAVVVVGVLLAFRSACSACLGADTTHPCVERRLVAHQGHARRAGRGAVEACPEARFHIWLADAAGSAQFAGGEAVATSRNARLHFLRHRGMAGSSVHVIPFRRYCPERVPPYGVRDDDSTDSRIPGV